MDVLGTRLVVDPGGTVQALAFVFGGIALGTTSGLTPGLHVNNLALLLAAAAPAVPGPPHLVAATMLAAGVAHSFLDVVPALALGVPDASMALTALPGHRLVIAGRGREALRLSAVGSAGAVLGALPLAVPVTAGMTRAYPVVRRHLPVVLGLVTVFLVATEFSARARAGAVMSFAASGALGLALLDRTPDAVLATGDMLMPLFAGLFGAPVLVDAIGGAGVPPQGDARIAVPRRVVAVSGTAGTLAGAVVGFVPGVSSAVAAVLALSAVPSSVGDRGFVVAVSGVNTANTVFALFALVTLGTPRTGVLVALDEAALPLDLPLLLASAVAAAAVGFVLVVYAGDRYLTLVGRLDYTAVSVFVVGLLVVASAAFAGAVGVAAFAVSVGVGLLPPRFGARRVHLMGVLVVPLLVG